ncbi:hypothetical protein A3860_39470 [Niastella vici]|uniref:Uncharacterized protein n=1 Tax=Niastella vici TaxID=1703345 RepID=A0A1V9FK00_9BACT|nr:hypothetical protein [Niastella vici]OQP58703.1 hypothetical protein A3860_39470 [Niastella vici]
MFQTRLAYLSDIDKTAKSIAEEFTAGQKITERLLKTIIDLYQSAKVEQSFKDEYFETAYHSPITGELEFFVARILFHYSAFNDKKWKIYLRRQESKTAPDIRLLKGDKTFAIIEVKAKAGWIQPFLSPERYQHDKNRLAKGKSPFDPDNLISNSKNQLNKYFTTFGLTSNDIFLFLPTLALVHRKKYLTELPEYYTYFASTSGLPADNLILLSNNKRLDLSYKTNDLDPTDNFEKLMSKLAKR